MIELKILTQMVVYAGGGREDVKKYHEGWGAFGGLPDIPDRKKSKKKGSTKTSLDISHCSWLRTGVGVTFPMATTLGV